jgi:hypothetical protein
MSLPIETHYTDEIIKEILQFLWSRQSQGTTKQKQRVVAKSCLSAGLEMGGLNIQAPEHIVQGFQQSLIIKTYKTCNRHTMTP